MYTTTPFDEMSEAESERIVAAALGQVPDVYREPLVLYYYEEVKAAGMHTDVADLPQQIEAACDLGGWSIELRNCFVAATTIDALQSCMMPTGN